MSKMASSFLEDPFTSMVNKSFSLCVHLTISVSTVVMTLCSGRVRDTVLSTGDP